MNYLDVYKKCFSLENYANCEHIQYNYVINSIKNTKRSFSVKFLYQLYYQYI